MSIHIGYKTDVGKKRKVNQDSYAILHADQLKGAFDTLLLVADGMGGRPGGDVASSIVAQVVPESVRSAIADRNGNPTPIDTPKLLRDAITQANKSVRRKQEEVLEFSGMGTTCVVGALAGNRLTLAHVGDSRAYLLRDGELKQLTDDHSEVWEQVKAGNMTPEEAQHSRFRNIVSRALGTANPTPEVQNVELLEGDSLLICSDGLTTELDDPEIARIFAGEIEVQSACDQLVQAALEQGGRDNITVVALRYGVFSPRTLPRVLKSQVPMEWVIGNPIIPAGWDSFDEEEDLALEDTPSPIYRNSPVLLALLLLMTVAILSETYALYTIWQKMPIHHEEQLPVIQPSPLRPTEKTLAYGAPISIFAPKVRDTPLALDRDGYPVVVTEEGEFVSIEELKAQPLPNQLPLPGVPTKNFNSASVFALAYDESGNRYQFNPHATHPAIEKFNPQGTRIEEALGGAKPERVTSIIVDESGDVFYIDNHHLKKIPATEKTP